MTPSRLNDVNRIDLMDLDIFEHGTADEVFEVLRNEAPVFWNRMEGNEGASGFWAITKYEDMVRVLKDNASFSSEYGNMLRLFGHKDPAAGAMMVVTDPPKHQLLRQLHHRAFTPQLIAGIDGLVHSFVGELLDQVPANQTIDFVEAVASKLPVCITCEIMGIPREDWAYIAELSVASFAAEDSEQWGDEQGKELLLAVNTELLGYFLDLIAYRKKRPGSDIISHLIQADIDGTSLTDREIALNGFSLLLGGNETTKYAAAGGLLALLNDEEALGDLTEDRSKLPSAVEEILRWTTPNVHIMRVAKKDTEIRGGTILAGQAVSLWTASANRDEDYFNDPYRFDIHRSPNRHLTFGIGNHYCLGSQIARTELKLLFQEILDRSYKITLQAPAKRVRSNFLGGVKSLFVQFSQA